MKSLKSREFNLSDLAMWQPFNYEQWLNFLNNVGGVVKLNSTTIRKMTALGILKPSWFANRFLSEEVLFNFRKALSVSKESQTLHSLYIWHVSTYGEISDKGKQEIMKINGVSDWSMVGLSVHRYELEVQARILVQVVKEGEKA